MTGPTDPKDRALGRRNFETTEFRDGILGRLAGRMVGTDGKPISCGAACGITDFGDRTAGFGTTELQVAWLMG